MVMYAFTDEQLQLRETVQRFLVNHSTTKTTRALIDSADSFDTDTYKALLLELGIGGIHVPEHFGGVGLGYVELCIVLEEMGRNLYPSPFFSSNVLATNAILNGDSEQLKSTLLPQLVNGDAIGTVALYEASDNISADDITTAVKDNRYTGTKRLVTHAPDATVIVIAARDGNENDGRVHFWIACNPIEGMTVKPTESLDETRPLYELSFTDTPVERLSTSTQSYSNFIDHAIVALANEMVGGAQALLDSAVEYANNRVQFGRPISSMQAIKHKCADLLLEVELAKSAAYRAAQAISDDDPSASEIACIAKAAASEAYMQAATDTIQVHGGIGFTWENDTHLWFRRAKSSQVWFGATEVHRETFLQHTLSSN